MGAASVRNALFSGSAFTLPCRISTNGLAIKLNALIDTGAGSYVLIHPKHLRTIKKGLQAPIQSMEAIPLAGYDSRPNGQADEHFRADLVLDGHRLTTHFVFCNTGRHDLIIGRKLLEDADVWVNCKQQALKWPDTALFDIKRDITIPTRGPTTGVNPAHQADANRRDKLMDVAVVRYASRSPQQSPERRAYQRNLIKMKQQLSNQVPQSQPPLQQPARRKLVSREQLAEAGLEVNTVGAAAFMINARQKETVIGHISVYEVERLIQDRKEELVQTNTLDPDEQLRQLIAEKLPSPGYAGATLAHFSKKDSDVLPPHRDGVDHNIELIAENTLSSSPLYSMSLEQLQLVKDYLDDHLRRGFISHSNAPYASPVLFAKKPGGGWRFCVDYRKLNAITKKDAYPIPLIQETLTRLARAKVFTKLDVRQAFYRIRLNKEVEDLTTFRTRYGNYKYRVLPFGLCNGPATFQRYINKVLHGLLDDSCTAYLDDILIYSEDPLQHEDHVAQVLKRLQEAGLQADIKKSEFAVTKTKFLGLIISTQGIQKDPEKVAVVQDWPVPTSVKSLQSFLGFCNFYRAFLKDYGRIIRPLTKLLKKGAWHAFDERELTAFQQAKDLMLSDNVLAHYSPYRLTRIETDASDGVVAGVLSQLQDDGLWRPVAFYSKTMSAPQMNYDIHDKEMLAVIYGLKEWRSQLIGLQTTEPFSAITDHRALEYFSTKRELTPRQMRWAMTVADFNLKLTYRPGTANVVADALSRKQEELQTQKEKDKVARTRAFLKAEQLDVNMVQPTADQLADLAAQGLQQQLEIAASDTFMASPSSDDPDALIDQVIQTNRSHGSLRELRDEVLAGKRQGPWELNDRDLLLYQGRLFVPAAHFLRTHLIRAVHATQVTAHPSKRKTAKLLREQYYWPKLSKDVDTYVAACKACRWSHIPRDRTPGLLKSLPIPERAWQDISMDFKSFPPDKKGYDNAFVVVDRLSKRCFSLPCHKTTTAEQAADMYYRYIWRVYGPPKSIVSDRGPQFISAFMNELCRLMGIKQKLSTAYHPQTDGNTEIVNQYLDQRLRPFVNYHQDNWSDLLPCMDWAQAILPHETTGLSPYEIEFGHQPIHHWDWKERTRTSPTAREQMSREEAQNYAKVRHDAVKAATEIAQRGVAQAQERQAQQANKKRREPDFLVGDQVYVTPRGFTTSRPSQKLDQQMYGPYPIIAMKGHSYQVKLPQYMHMHDVFHADRLRKATEPLLGQAEPEEQPIEVNGNPEWAMNEILDSRIYRGRLQYRASWTGCDPDSTWYNAHGFMGAPYKVRDYHQAYPKKPGPPARLEAWLQAYEDGRDLETTEEDDEAVSKSLQSKARRRK